MDDALKDLAEHIALAEPHAVQKWSISYGELTLSAVREHVAALIKFLRVCSQCRSETLIDICGVDYPQRRERFEVVYHLLSMRMNQRIRVKCVTDEDTPVPSIMDIFPAAQWYEREALDMYGISFAGNDDLRRLLTDYGFEGHPLRKDFPLTGYVEVRYDELEKRVVYEPVKLTQEYRNFDFLSPWEGAQAVIPGDEKAENGAG